MGLFEQLPYANFHELNLDWFLKTFKELLSEWEEQKVEFASLKEAWEALQEFVTDYFDNLDVQEEINNKLEEMAESGAISLLLSPFVPNAVSEWLTNNITPTTPIIDASLSISGAGADAEVTGDRIREINTTLAGILSAPQIISFNIHAGGLSPTSGAGTSNSARARTTFIPVNVGACYSVVLSDPLYTVVNAVFYETTESETITRALVFSNTTNVFTFTPEADEAYVRISFAHLDRSTEVTTEQLTTIKNALAFYGLTDTTLEVPGAAADAYTVGAYLTDLRDALTDVFNTLYRSPVDLNTEFLKGYSIGGGGTYVTENAARCRTDIITLNTEETYRVKLDDSDYQIIAFYLYNGTNIANVSRRIDNVEYFTTSETENVARVVFACSDDTQEVTDADVTAIEAAFSISQFTDKSLSIEDAPADAKAVGEALHILDEATEHVNVLRFNSGPVENVTVRGITYSIDEDMVITLNGTSTNHVYFDIMGGSRANNIKNLPAGTPIIFKREQLGGEAGANLVLRYSYDTTQDNVGTTLSQLFPFVPQEDACLFLRIASGTTFNNARFKCSITYGVTNYPLLTYQKSAVDIALRETYEQAIKNKAAFDDAIKSKNRMLFSAHRGAEGIAPYGSYPAYELACENGWDMVQIARARQSSNGTWYCLHDPDVDAQTNGTGLIASLTDAYIDTIYQDVGVNIENYTHEEMKLPTLESILQLCYKYGLMVSVRLGSLGEYAATTNWESFIELCSKYRPERMMFSGTPGQVITLKALTPNWHGQLYFTETADLDWLDVFIERGYTNMSILANRDLISDATLEKIRNAGYYYVATAGQMTLSELQDLSDDRCDIAQTGLNNISSLT